MLNSEFNSAFRIQHSEFSIQNSAFSIPCIGLYHSAVYSEAERLARRAKREERRERQRAQNLCRAKKMHAARLEFEREGHATVANEPPALNIGCSGWFYWHWRDRFYPKDLPTKNWFDHYASNFRTVELNAPFYSWPTVANVETWIRQAGLATSSIRSKFAS